MQFRQEVGITNNEPLAIIGIGCRLPGNVIDAETYWAFLTSGRSGIVEVPADRWSLDRFYHQNGSIPGRMITRWGGFVDHVEDFDARFWGITPREAMRMDPQQRWLLEVAWEALEDAGIPPSRLEGEQVGVFVGISTHDYSGLQGQALYETDAHTNSGSTLSIASNRISYLLNLKGPSLSVDTACSSSLVALSIACRSIWAGECNSALIGGVNVMCAPHATLGFSKASMLSPDGQCFAFDSRANGYVRGEGAGMVYVKRLSDAQASGDPIYAVLRAAVINQDGHTSSMTVPGAEAQAAMLRRAYREAGVSPSRVMYMEAHGTGTPVGDPIELSALGEVLSRGRGRDERCLIGSVKSNIGHLEAGSGIAGLIKAALVLHKDMVPPNPNFRTPSPHIPFEQLKLRVADRLQPLPHRNGELPVTAVNSFGFGGTNSHAVLEAFVDTRPAIDGEPNERANRPFVLPISGRGPEALRAATERYLEFLQKSKSPLADICGSAGNHKEHHEDRLVVVGGDVEQIRQRLTDWLATPTESIEGVTTGRATGATPSIVFVFTGQGAQWWAMGQQLIQREPIFRHALEAIDQLLGPMGGFSLVEEMTRSEATSRINETDIAQPAIFGLQVALSELWKSWGIVPSKVVGHSVGEVAAAYVAGIYSLEDAVKIIYHRSRLQHSTAGTGKMLAAGIPSRDARHLIGDAYRFVQIAAVNSSNLITLAGETEPLQQIANKLAEAGKFHRWLAVDYPFHTHLMDPIEDELREVLADIHPQPTSIPFISTVTGGIFHPEKMDATYWWSNVRNPVLFAPAIANIVRAGEDLFLEIGPHPALKGSVSETIADLGCKGTVCHSLKRESDESVELLGNLAALHVHGTPGIHWDAVNQGSESFVRLPHYPWQRERYWLEEPEAAEFRLSNNKHPLLGMRRIAANPTWEFRLDPRLFPWLESHRFWDSILFPAAGYGEIALALARAVFPDEPYAVEDLLVKKALFVSENDVPTVRVEFNPVDKSFTIRSSTGEKTDWDLHVEGRLTEYNSPVPPQLDLDDLRARLPKPLGHDEYYENMDKAGYHFGPHFKLIQNVRISPGEGLVEVVVPTGPFAPEAGHFFHTVLLDACIQAARTGIDAEEDSPCLKELYLPRRLGRVRMYRPEMPNRFWAYARQITNNVDTMTFDIAVCDDEGERVCDVLGFQSELMEHIREADDAENCLYQYEWEVTDEPSAHDESTASDRESSDVSTPLPTGATYIVFADRQGFAESLACHIEGHGGTALLVFPGKSFQSQDRHRFTVNPDSEEDYRVAIGMADRLDGVIHCWSLDHPTNDSPSTRALAEAQTTGVLSALKLTHVLAERTREPVQHVWVMTRDAQPVVEADAMTGIRSTPLLGMARVAANEHTNICWKSLDLPAQGQDTDADLVIRELTRTDNEHELAFRDGRRYARRIVRARAADFPRRLRDAVLPNGEVLPYQLQIETPGILSNLALHETTRRAPGPDEIEARVIATGINFRNVMRALGMPIGNTDVFPGFGEDFAGVVLRVGDKVTNVKPGDAVLGLGYNSFRSYVTTGAHAIIKKPEHISFTDAATIPTVFATAYYAIKYLAHAQAGERILIHAGTGGVGQAAIQIARDFGLEILATAGSDEKRQLLRDLGVDHVMNSRTLDFVDDVRTITNGRGVDIVLNSLAGDFLTKSMSVLAPFGRFIEIGKVDIFNNSKIGMKQLANNVSFIVFDLIEYIVHKIDQISRTYREIGEKFETGVYQPLTHTDFPITNVEEAYRYMAQGKHVGKNVLTYDCPSIPIGPCTEDGKLFRREGTYLVTGGASGFGLEVAKWMARHGAGHIVLFSRSGPRDDDALAVIEKMKGYGARVTDARGDVTNFDDVQRVVGGIQENGSPLLGVVHAAMVLRDELLADLNDESFEQAFAPKVLGAWNLHLATRDLTLEHFILFSSFSAAIGAPKQGNYNAGNVFLDALAHHRRAADLPALTVNWGAISGAGFVERNKKTAQYLDAIGMKSIHFDDALRVLRRLLQHEVPQVLVSRADWALWRRAISLVGRSNTYAAVAREQSEAGALGSIGPRIRSAPAEDRAAMLELFIAENLAAVCSIDATGVDMEVPLTSLGLDSLMAVELMNRIEGNIGLSVPMGKVLAGPTIRELAAIILQMMAGSSDEDGIDGNTSSESGGSFAPLESTPRRDWIPLSEYQRELWRISPVGSMSIADGLVFVAKVKPRLDLALLSQSVAWTAERHPLLRTTFQEQSGQITQGVQGELTLEHHDATGVPEEALAEIITHRTNLSFDLSNGPVARIEVITTSSNCDLLLVACHRIIADRQSMTIVVNDLLDCYGTLQDGTEPSAGPLKFSFQDFVEWETKQIRSTSSRKRYEFWRDHLLGAPVELSLPTVGAENGTAASASRFAVEPNLCQQLLALAAEQEVTPYHIILTAYQLLLHHLCGQRDLVIGSSLPGRQHRELERVVGPLENTVCLRSVLRDDPSFVDRLLANQQLLDQATKNQQYPFRRLVARLGVPGSDGVPHLYKAALVMDPYPALNDRMIPSFLLGKAGHSFRTAGSEFLTVDVDIRTADDVLTLHMAEAAGSLYGTWHGTRSAAEASTLTRVFTHLLRQVAANPLRPISQLSLDLANPVPFAQWTDASHFSEVVRRPTDDLMLDDLELIDPQAEAQLDPSIAPPNDRSFNFDRFNCVFLTGATGFVGAFIIDELIRKTSAEIRCLVRCDDMQHGMERLRRNLSKYGLDPDLAEGRLTVVVGDLTVPMFGLSDDEFDQLAREVDVIYHNGADINIALPYAGLRPVNVHGTHEVLRLAMRHHIKPTHIVSSYAVHATRGDQDRDRIREDEPLPPFERLANGYSKSKWVVENMANNARKLGVPISLYRPGNITGHSRTGASNTGDVMHALLLSMLHVGAVPVTDAQIDLTPVDYVAGAIVELSRQRDCLGRTYHLLNHEPMRLALLSEMIQDADLAVEVVSVDEFRERLAGLDDSLEADALSVLSEVLTPDAASGTHDDMIPAAFLAKFDCENAIKYLAKSGVSCHPVDRTLLSRYMEHLRNVGFLDLASRQSVAAWS